MVQDSETRVQRDCYETTRASAPDSPDRPKRAEIRLVANLLIVDDDPSIRALFARALQRFGDIDQAPGGADALLLLQQKRYDLVLVDLHMPVIDGFVVLHMLATKPGPNRDTPVYVISADTSDESRVRALRRHAVFMLTKPVPIATLVSLVDSTLQRRASVVPGKKP